MDLITFTKHFFSFTFYNKFVDIYNLFPCKTAYYVKRKQILKKNLLSKVGPGTGTITFQKSEPEP